MGALLDLSLRQMAGKRRLAIILILAAIPVGLAILLSRLIGDEADFSRNFSETILDALFIGVIVPIVVMTLATTAFGNELEDRTLNVLVLKPIPRYAIVIPKYLASIIVSGIVLVIATALIVGIALNEGGVSAVLTAILAVGVCVITYAALFTWAGLMTSKALGFALVYVFLWEQFLTRFVRGTRYFSVREYTLSILNGLDEDTFGAITTPVLDWPAALIAAGVITALFLGLTVRRLSRMDVP
jgi:ABC-2 type transport system permease protein